VDTYSFDMEVFKTLGEALAIGMLVGISTGIVMTRPLQTRRRSPERAGLSQETKENTNALDGDDLT